MQFASLFQDHAVLQRHTPIPVWGKGAPGETVTVRLAGNEAKATVAASGLWSAQLPSLPEGGPYTLEAEAPSGRIAVSDILIGEVWLCSGQSNMEWTLAKVGGEASEALPTLPKIRILTVTNAATSGEATAIEGAWSIASPEALYTFSAVGGYFGRHLHECLDLPIGLICNAWGGTRIQAWLSRNALLLEPEGRAEMAYYEALLSEPSGVKRPPSFEEWLRAEAPRGSDHPGHKWAAPDFDDADWRQMELPTYWQAHGHQHSGVFWFRRRITLPAAWHGRALELSLGALDKEDETWGNGCLIGRTDRSVENSWAVARCYPLPSSLVGEDGTLQLAIRVTSYCHAGGFAGPPDAMWIAPAGAPASERLSLGGMWAYAVEADWGEIIPPALGWGPGNPNTPSILFSNRIAPIVPYALRGVIWYQGESNVGEANLYRRLMPALIADWRRAWGTSLPFFQVQLANYRAPTSTPGESAWAALREAQAAALTNGGTGLAVAIDIGEAGDIHPRNKRDVGKRLAQSALSEVYHRGGVPMGPLFTHMTHEANGRIRCYFRFIGGGLEARGGGKLRHFALAGLDRAFHWADAVIEGETVVVSCPDVPLPYAVRYAWADNPEGCNLYNTDGLPASPFRSDAWPVE